MKKNINISGLCYRIRPVNVDDAEFIIKTRLEDSERNKYIHRISPDVSAQREWIERYLPREDDYYFIVENIFTNLPEGLVGIYDIANGCAEWGRWVIQKGSMAAIESLELVCRAAFDILELKELYCHTISDNTAVVSFHNSAREKFRRLIPNGAELDGNMYELTEHYIDSEYWRTDLSMFLQSKAQRVFEMNMRMMFGKFEFHHIGLATSDFDREFKAMQTLGYCTESPEFRDDAQGIYGRFLTSSNMPRMELLRNTENSSTLDSMLNNHIKMYHFGYIVEKFDVAVDAMLKRGAVMIREPMTSVYFGKRICFLLLPNMFMIELIEE